MCLEQCYGFAMLEYSQEWCMENINHKDYWTRYDVAKHIDISYLPQMMNDGSWSIRCNVSRRIDISYLPKMINDESADVRYEVARRIHSTHLPQMMNDENWDVRCEVAKRIDKKNALLMSAFDEIEMVRKLAWNNVMGSL
jgi:hypothetical protein